jgi:hypothetical protein
LKFGELWQFLINDSENDSLDEAFLFEIKCKLVVIDLLSCFPVLPLCEFHEGLNHLSLGIQVDFIDLGFPTKKANNW